MCILYIHCELKNGITLKPLDRKEIQFTISGIFCLFIKLT